MLQVWDLKIKKSLPSQVRSERRQPALQKTAVLPPAV